MYPAGERAPTMSLAAVVLIHLCFFPAAPPPPWSCRDIVQRLGSWRPPRGAKDAGGRGPWHSRRRIFLLILPYVSGRMFI
ncbi:hypothetical protein F5X68DRAFT_207806 [Plectosphaerella plurivora]|uniref:Secreted protein n=1 Tax=Plectosphaerella plurivora TaxID=936078 RepID=A0A9P8VB62_9PEZI|nr:hypothetical protein F5X68DRAFT_207806 [Plectosphaerella plurivora]